VAVHSLPARGTVADEADVGVAGRSAGALVPAQSSIKQTGILHVAVLAAVGLFTETLVVPYGVVTAAVVTGGLHGALVDVLLAGPAHEARPGTVALEAVDFVSADPAVLTRNLSTVVNVCLTIVSSVARLAQTLSAK